ncbi:MAG: hypothetical protein PUG34_06585 [Eubacteriales bacterium]|nr:hypothetical protein [Eubacteriales bacterium]
MTQNTAEILENYGFGRHSAQPDATGIFVSIFIDNSHPGMYNVCGICWGFAELPLHSIFRKIIEDGKLSLERKEICHDLQCRSTEYVLRG